MPIIEAEGLEKTYPGPVKAVCGIDLSVDEGTIFGLLGPNGAGKSTTARILTTLARPSAGTARIAGHDICQNSTEIRRKIGYVAQSTTADAQLSARENLILQGRLFGLNGKALGHRIATLLDLFQLEDAAGRLVRTYSGGMRRRLDLAMGLIHRPKILFLDEPSSGLDPESRSVMWKEVERLARDEGITVFLTTHYLEEADRLADAVAIIDQGRVVAQGTPTALKAGLEGDRIDMGFPDEQAADLARGRLQTLKILLQLSQYNTRLSVMAKDGAGALPQIMSALSDLEVSDMQMTRPSLDEVYLSVTGKRMKPDADPEPISHKANGRRAA